MSEPRHRIRLDDIVGTEIRKASYEIREEEFPMNTASISKDDIVQRLKKYHSALSRLTCVAILLGKWGSQEHQPLIERIVARLADGTEVRSGKIAWLGLRWYPTMLILYSGGIAALSSNNYLSLSTLLTTKLRGSTTGKDTQTAVVSTVEGILELDRIELFKKIPGYENYYAPRSEYLFKSLQPQLEDLLFLGNGYEDDFDRFEIFYALVYLDLQSRLSGHIWAPPGRFAWKERHGYSTYNAVVDDAKQHGDTWGPVSVGLFARSLQRFEGLATSFREQVLDKLSWW